MGFFCIDYIDNPKILSEDEINRLRNLASQAGIALYHAKLYEQAQACFRSRKNIASEFKEQLIKPTSDILDTSKLLQEQDFERDLEINYLDRIISSCHEILELSRSEY